ncbi:MAG: aminotransferase class I/II-fold pyridoxal phosphate-dependent enzyme [Gemmatimonadetes bacterium]|nr:aminotransferase class I/II-fold pyridoxal phosphate-dependent enzyme [Gemmatimonadota bacterium]MYG84259.1 aminotransferase class I/II-fold pyridoxal phosphate-dependent enzyme [Gemmatimonadota bacterium]MYJ90561.1 aminotransferase class I/II-fold pyridoxal phosphate-dependent enzyme [Gemmatimonadota bacterium]
MLNRIKETVDSGLSRRRFLSGALAAGAALTLADRLALAQTMASGGLTAKDIHGIGVEPGLVRMALNENPIGPSPRALEAIAENMFNINRYSFGGGDIYGALAEFDGMELPPPPPRFGGTGRMGGGGRFFRQTPFYITAGSGALLSQIALTYLSKGGTEVIEADMGYGDISGAAEIYQQFAGLDVNIIRTPMKDYTHDLDAMLAAITPKTSVVVITNPNNPTGTLLSFEETEKFVAAVPENVIVVIDEAYIHFVKDPQYRTAASLTTKYDNVIVTRTFSKVFGMPAMRLGYGICSQAIQQKLRFYSTGRANALAMAAGEASLKDKNHYNRSRAVVQHFRDRLEDEFTKMGLEYIPSESNFMMVDLGKPSMNIMREMFQKGVMVTNRRRQQMPTWIRVSSGDERETEVFLNVLKEALGKTS